MYWVVAARLFAPAVVGINSTIVSTLTMLAGLAQLNLGSALLRFLDGSAGAARRLVARCYAVAAVVGCVAGLGFALGAPWWAPDLVSAVGARRLVLLFVLAGPVWTLFVMQDYVLTAARRAVLVPVENLGFSVLKVGLLVVAATLGLGAGIAVSWTAATAVAVLVVSVVVWRVLPRGGPSVPVHGIVRYAAADWAGTICLNILYFGLPLVVLYRLGPEDAAVYGIAWTLSFSLYLVAQNMGQSLVAHLAASPERVRAASREMVLKSLTLVVPAALVLAVGAPWLLAIFGEHYARSGAVVLALTALSAIPNTVSAAGIAVARVRNRRLGQIGIPALAAVTVLLLAGALMEQFGLEGVGAAILVGQSLTALVLLMEHRQRRTRRRG